MRSRGLVLRLSLWLREPHPALALFGPPTGLKDASFQVLTRLSRLSKLNAGLHYLLYCTKYAQHFLTSYGPL